MQTNAESNISFHQDISHTNYRARIEQNMYPLLLIIVDGTLKKLVSAMFPLDSESVSAIGSKQNGI